MDTSQRPVAVVTGAAGNIGLPVCEQLVAQGCHVVACDLGPPPAALPAGCTFRELDVRDEAALRRVLDDAAAAGPLTHLVIAHGIFAMSFIEDAARADLLPITEINLLAVAQLCVEAGKRLRPGGSIVTVSSVVATMGRRADGGFMYTAIKAGVESLTRNFAVGLGPKGIRVNSVAPGFLSTPMAGVGQQARQMSKADELKLYSPLGRLATPHEVANAIVFLCSDAASGISGVVLPVDVGHRAW
ncbi:SDR family oxidoreductase [Ramlibacter sp. AW1]|uniref:SDR family oxidoreductase n=1 Tax=Ramlibacter aurantiacus TaxID=2801330 RepID=A0A936ZJ00_9BURK|nr:SDR family oxidoreductase [Ramlibacter aurantiacus]